VTRDDDWIDQLFIANTHDTILCFRTRTLYWLKVWEARRLARVARQADREHVPLAEGEKITVVLPVRAFDGEHFVFMARPNVSRRTGQPCPRPKTASRHGGRPDRSDQEIARVQVHRDQRTGLAGLANPASGVFSTVPLAVAMNTKCSPSNARTGSTTVIFSPSASGNMFTIGLPRDAREPCGASHTFNQ